MSYQTRELLAELAECEGVLRTMLKWRSGPTLSLHCKQAIALAEAFSEAQRHLATELHLEPSNALRAGVVRTKGSR